MSDVIPFKGQKMAKAFAHLDPNKTLGEGIQSGFPPILGYRGKVWTLQYQGQKHPFKREDDGTALTYIDCIIVGVADNLSKIYYPPGEFDEDSAERPTCASINSIVPDPGVPEPQSKTCVTCKWYGWTTLPNGQRGKICQDHKRLAILLMPAMTKKLLGTPLVEPVYLKIPPGSLTSLKSYGEMLKHEGFAFASVVTRVSFAPDKLFRMVFEPKKALTDTEAPWVLPLVEDPRTKRIIGDEPEIREVKPAIAKKPEPEEDLDLGAFGAPAAAPKPAPKAKAVVIEPDEEEGEVIPPEPVKKRGPKTKAGNGNAPAPVEVQGELPGLTLPMDEEDSELDREFSELLDLKVKDMLT